MTEGGDQGDASTSSGDRYIQSPFPSVVEKWPKPVQEPSTSILPVADADDDRVPFISLHALEVLHKKSLFSVLPKELIQLLIRMHLKRCIECRLDPESVFDPHRNDTQGLLWPCPRMLKNQLNDPLHFS